MVKNRFYILISILLFANLSFAQDIDYAREIIKNLASTEMSGRGYLNEGDLKAANYIASEFEKHDLQMFKTGFFKKSYFQDYKFPINTITDVNYFVYGSDTLIAGEDYMIGAASTGVNSDFNIEVLLEDDLKDKSKLEEVLAKDLSNTYIVTNGEGRALIYKNVINAAGIIYLSDNIIWSVSGAQKPQNYTVIYLKSDLFNSEISNIAISFDNNFVKKHKTQNVVGFIEGSKYPDSFFVFTAHYDHIGMMGKDVIFPGANDNASGTAMIMDLAKHYSKSKPEYSVVFIAFSGEEAGLHGSRFFSENPLFPLENIKLLINLDMVGTGSDGIAFVNGSVFSDLFQIVNQINEEKNYLKRIKARGEACNSDHCFFYKKGVPAFFIYSMGKEHMHYHSIYDRAEILPLTKYDEIFKLLTDFVSKLEEG